MKATKKILSFLLALVMLLGMFPMAAAAGEDVTISTGHTAEYMQDHYLSQIVLHGTGGTLSGDGYSWKVILPADTDTTKPLDISLTGSVYASMASARFLWACGTEEVVGDMPIATQNPQTLTVMPEWKSGRATITVGVGVEAKIITSYAIKLEIEGSEPDYSVVELDETNAKKYFLGSLEVENAEVIKSEVYDTAFSGSSKHKATVDFTLASMPEGGIVNLKLNAMATGSAYITADGGSRVEYNGEYTAQIDLNKAFSVVFVTYSTATNSTVRGTYTVNFEIEGGDYDLPPVLTGAAEAAAEVWLPDSYTLDLSEIFTDPNRDELTYSVCINGKDAEEADPNYTFTPQTAGEYVLVFTAFDGYDTSEAYTVTITVPHNEAPVISGDAVYSFTAVRFAPWSIDLSAAFTDADGDELTYAVKTSGGNYLPVSGSVYTYTPTEENEATVTFKANDGHADSEEYTVTLQIEQQKVSHVVAVGQTVSNGSFDHIRITDTNDGIIDGLSLSMEGTTLSVTLPRTVGANGKVRAWFHLTQNGSDGTTALPFVSTKTGASGTSSGQARYNIVSYCDTALSSGKALATVYFYNKIPSATNNAYTTYTVRYALENNAPVLTGAASKADRVVAGEAYAVAFHEIFSDADGDELTYTVSVNGGAAETVDADYSYMPTVATTDVLVFTASDGLDVSEAYTLTLDVSNSSVTYDVTVYVPEGLSPVFYATAGYDESGVDTFTETAPLTAMAGATADGFTAYTVKVPETVSVISFRDSVWGGASAEVSEGKALYLEDFSGYIDHIHAGQYVTADQAVFMVKDNGGHYAVSGGSATDEELDGMTYYRFLLPAIGNDGTYTFIAKGTGDLASIYGETVQPTFALEPDGQTFAALSLTVSDPITITVPEGCEAALYRQINNYNTTKIEHITKKTANGLTVFTFKSPGSANYNSWRAWDPNDESKITKAGFFNYNETAVTVTWSDEDPASDVQVGYSDTLLGMRHDATAVVNVNAQNHLVLAQDGSFRLRGFRWWQIINNDVNNIMVEPDFTYTVHTGADVIGIDATNGGNGMGNRMDITATGTGMAVVEVGFDAISMQRLGYEQSGFVFGACDPDRTALVVVSVGEATVDADFGIAASGAADSWDAEFDTFYFVGEQGRMALSPNMEGTLSVSHDKGKTWKPLTAKDGVYTAPIISGNNILKLETESGVDYQVVRGGKITVSLTNVTSGKEADAPIAAGDTVQISFDGLHHAMSKMSGIYNPGYQGGTTAFYSAKVGDAYVGATSGVEPQYRIVRSATFAVPESVKEGDVIDLVGGYLTYNNMGSGAGAHRGITDTGVGTNTSATSKTGANCRLPDLKLTVGSNEITWEETVEPEITKFSMTGSNMTLGNELEVNFLFKKADLTGTDNVAIVTHHMADGTTKVTEIAQADWASMGTTYHKVSARIAAKEMADTLTIEIVDADGYVLNEAYSDSVRGYAGRALASSSTTEFVRIMMIDMLNYGAAAQAHFKYNTADLANNALTEEQQALATAKVECINKQVKDATVYGANLSLEDSILLNTFFKGLKGKDIASMYAMVRFTDFQGNAKEVRMEGSEFEQYGSSGDIYKIVVDDVVLADAKTLVTVTLYSADGTVFGAGTDSVESYVARAEENGADTYGLYANIMKFAASAYNYIINK